MPGSIFVYVCITMEHAARRSSTQIPIFRPIRADAGISGLSFDKTPKIGPFSGYNRGNMGVSSEHPPEVGTPEISAFPFSSFSHTPS